MTFVSYAQNFEDVMLWRALKHIEQGFYIDVGAWSPDLDSVTRAFYERGWSGINIEPNPEFHRQFQERRLRDRNLRLAVADREGLLTMNFLDDAGLSTLDDAIAYKHKLAGLILDRQEVQVTTLTILWHQHVPTGQNVHFLKVDVEGSEEVVLRGNDWTVNRPWVVVVEATFPNTRVETHEAWEPVLLAANYYFAYADGLNRFYVASERAELLPNFKYPPNVFDDFISGSQQLERIPQLEAEKAQLVAQLQASEADRAARLEVIEAQGQQLGRIPQLEAEKDQLVAQLQASETDRAARLEVIEAQGQQLGRIDARLQASEADRAGLYANLWVRIGRKVGFISTK